MDDVEESGEGLEKNKGPVKVKEQQEGSLRKWVIILSQMLRMASESRRKHRHTAPTPATSPY